MISVTIEKKDGQYRRLSCKGHAGYAKYGTDIVCAAASILVINTLNAIEELTPTQFTADSDAKSGLIRADFTGQMTEGAVLLLDAMVMGLEGIEQEYGGKYIHLQVIG